MKPLMLVSEMESAVLPSNIKVSELELAPPGQAAMMTKPTWKAGGKPDKWAIANAIKGKAMICKDNPVMKALGLEKTFL